MPQPRDLPTDLEWFRAQEFSPDDLDEDEDRASPAARPAPEPPASPAPEAPKH